MGQDLGSKNPVAKELRTNKYRSKVMKNKKKYDRKKAPIWVNEDEEYCKHLMRDLKNQDGD